MTRSCRYDRETKTHLLRTHLQNCKDVTCDGCKPCEQDDNGNLVTHCRTRNRCTSHLTADYWTCPECLDKIRNNLRDIIDKLDMMPNEAAEAGVNSEAANLAGPHADYVTASWRLINADRAGEHVEELDMTDPYTCLTMHERTIREELRHDSITLISDSVQQAASYLAWVLSDLAKSKAHVATLASLLADTAALRQHLDTALSDSHAPERGIPCPECVTAKRDAPRLIRHYSHWCAKPNCKQQHRDDQLDDEWRCPQNKEHVWTHSNYEARLMTRRRIA